ncbi:Right handed beta helix region [Bacteroides luti]|uniref:Right handed beta helix region n=1 Tax=Bacteroides luti TaxID=1297750 RepID=A0A1M4XUJ4_9BACE|nr:right-handed parallel beta-helix repeat-containing protein [Bacteroides luti]SHE97105.1 Right handed beta helix region [Bacteroides luti]
MTNSKLWIISILLLLNYPVLFANQIISVADFGLKPDSRVNSVPYVRKALEACRKQPGSTLFFPKGRYDFWPQYTVEREYFESNTTDNNPKTLAVLLDSLHNFTLDGNGSSFVMHGRMQPITLDHCSDINLKGFTIDWDIPLTSQAKVLKVTPDYFEIEINTHESPYIIENNNLVFVGEGWKSKLWSIMEFTSDTHLVAPNTGDRIGWRNYHAEEVSPGIVRLSDPSVAAFYPKEGNWLVLRHNERDHAGIFLYHSQRINLEQIDVYHSCGLGILSQYSQDLSFNKVRVVPNASKNRILSGHDDGFHFMGCGGFIRIEECEWAGLMDDPVNIHGTCVRIVEILSPTRIKCKFMHEQSQGMEWGRKNEKVGFIENQSMRTLGTGTMTSFEPLNKSEFIVEFQAPVPNSLKVGAALENLSCTADVEIRNSFFGSCRARGLLVSTPGKVIIENNIFESSGSAILIAGDANQWYESGAVKDVLIRNNTFRYPCMSSVYQFCEAVISIFPEIPKPDIRYPFHSNIRIENNKFYLFDYPILYAKSVDGLSFVNNTLIRDTTYQPFHYRKDGITLDACRKVIISGNRAEGNVLGKTIRLHDMKPGDLKLRNESFFQLRNKP